MRVLMERHRARRSEAVEVATTDADTNYELGPVLNHVLLHQTVIGRGSSRNFHGDATASVRARRMLCEEVHP